MSNLKKACEMALNEEMEKMDKAYAVSLIDGHIDRPITNYDRIKKMSVEEMAELISKGECHCCKQTADQFCGTMTCKQGVKQWLESEVETE